MCGFYLDILKDRLYTTAVDSAPRRAAQTALWHITQSLLRLMAPVLSFTAEEAYAIVNPVDGSTIFTQIYYELPAVAGAPALIDKWKEIRRIRTWVQKELEEKRSAKEIGSSLQAEVVMYLNVMNRGEGQEYNPSSASDPGILRSLGDELKYVLITSSAIVHTRHDAAFPSGGGGEIVVTPSPHQKCERCWHYREEVGTHAEHPTLCGRCVSNLFGAGEPRSFA